MQELARRTMLDFTVYTKPDYQAGWFHREVCSTLDWFYAEVEAKHAPRLMLFAPPRHGKSELLSRRFPAYALGRNPDMSIIAASYGDTLAAQFNRDVQRIIESDQYHTVFPGTTLEGQNVRTVGSGKRLRNSDTFEIVGHAGVYNSAGVGGGITGKGADILLLDDLIKSEEEARSKTYRDKVYDWYCGDAYTRLSPGGGGILLLLTRRHEDDLPGRLLAAAKDGGEQWRVIDFAAIAEREEAHRRIGEALDPDRYSLAQLMSIKSVITPRAWSSLYQQHPTPQEGDLFKRQSWRFWRHAWQPAVPGLEDRTVVLPTEFDQQLQSWDCAFKAKEQSDKVAGGLWAVRGANKFLLDLTWKRLTFTETLAAVRSMSDRWPEAALKLVEDKANGTAVIDTLRNEIPGIVPVEPQGGKEARAEATSPQVEAGNVYLPLHAPWRDDYIEEHAGFPNAPHDDAVDQMTQALLRIQLRSVTVCEASGGTVIADEDDN